MSHLHDSHLRPVRVRALLLAAAGYVIAGYATAVLSGRASSLTGVKAWRLVAWLISLAIFLAHLAVERRHHATSMTVARYVGGAVALGAFGIAVLGPLRAHWGDPDRFRLALLSIVAWPLLAGLPAFVTVWILCLLLDRIRPASPQ